MKGHFWSIISNSGSGVQNNLIGGGTQNNNTGSGRQYIGGVQYFGEDPSRNYSNRQHVERTGRPSPSLSPSELREPKPSTPVDSSPPSNRSEFKIGIICALQTEFDAVAYLFDEYWEEAGDRYGRAPGDQNTYTTGRMGQHNVVLALLPGMGKVKAASAASNFRSSYQGIKLALLVGICGGVPYDREGREILLGDVIISQQVVQYDLGRYYPGGFQKRDTLQDNLRKNNSDISGFLETLKTRFHSKHLQRRTLDHLLALQREADWEELSYPGAAEDKLFESTYLHKHPPSHVCDICNQSANSVCPAALHSLCSEIQCDESHLVARRRLEDRLEAARLGHKDQVQAPAIHFGVIGSGDMVMKSGIERDNIARTENLIAFEMEGAGVWDNLSCIVIKGVCDYADSHKSKVWQNFAAATAASAMKALLERYSQVDQVTEKPRYY